MDTYKILYRANTRLRKLTRDSFRTLMYLVCTFLRTRKRKNTCWKRFVTKCNLPVFEYTPPVSTSSEIVILYLHGSGERGKDLWRLRLDSLPKLVDESPEKVPYSVVAPICPLRTEWTTKLQMRNLKILVRELRNRYRYIFVTGPSMGGRGTWRLAASCADLIAGAIPICGGGHKMFAPLIANHVPCWFFHAANDKCIDVSETDVIVSSLRSMIQPPQKHDFWCRYTRYKQCSAPWNAPYFEGHDAYNPCYYHSDVWCWIEKVVVKMSSGV